MGLFTCFSRSLAVRIFSSLTSPPQVFISPSSHLERAVPRLPMCLTDVAPSSSATAPGVASI